ncbi:MAG: amidohydrolase family protein [Gammaproteobacteria bacterium]
MRMMRPSIGLVAVFVLSFPLIGCQPDSPGPEAPAPDGPPPADQVLMNGKILTVDADFSVAQAVAIQGDRIVAVGTDESLAAYVGDTTEVLDLEGRTVIPGLIDNHMHVIRAVQRWNLQARIDGINVRQDALDVIAAKAASMEPGDWLMVQGGWRENQFADQPGGFTLEELDAAAPENPLFLQVTYQTVYANTLALEAVGVSPEEGAQHRGPPMISGQPPYGLLNEQMPDVSDAQLEQNMFDFVRELNRAGLTSVYDVGRPPEGDITLVQEMNDREPLPVRVWHTLKYQAYDQDGADAAVELVRASTANSNNDYYGLLGLGEHVYLPFFDNPNTSEPYSDDIVSGFMKIATAAAEGGFHIHEHTMADVTVRSLLGPFEELNERIPLAPLRWSLAHVFTIEPESIERATDLGLTIAIHSVAMYGTPERQPPLRQIQDSGIVWGLGTDSTIVAHYQPFITLGWTVSGKSINGNQVIDEPVTREEALIAHTRSNAYLMFKEDDIGSLEVGKLADLVVLDQDYMTIPVDDIFGIESVLTMVGGRVVYDTL